MKSEELSIYFEYNYDTGQLFRKPGKCVKIQREITCIAANGYIVVRIKGVSYLAHRIIWALVTGQWPEYEIDHINGIRSDNRFINLRHANRFENGQNLSKKVNNSSGFVGVSFSKDSKKWRAYIAVGGRKNGKQIHLGLFDDPEKAHNAYLIAKSKYHQFNSDVRQ